VGRGCAPGERGEAVPCKLSISKYGLRKRDNRANCTVCTVALLPEPWNASKVGFTGPVFEPLGGSLGVRYVAFWEDDIVVVADEGEVVYFSSSPRAIVAWLFG
jgi:hypothetical protein